MTTYNKPAFLRLLNRLNAVDGIDIYDSRGANGVYVEASHSEWAGFCKGLEPKQLLWLVNHLHDVNIDTKVGTINFVLDPVQSNRNPG